MLDIVRTSLVAEAIKSPNLLADLAGLETYIAESYDARSFIELLQNADDAGASRFYAEHFGDFLIVANDGNTFSIADFESLCRSSASGKSRGESIGYRGIGFKSVVGVSSRVHVVSGELAATFCRHKTKAEVASASNVPLVRIPHVLDLGKATQVNAKIRVLLDAGYKTLFIFEDLVAHAVATEFQSFDAAALLFLKHVSEAHLVGNRSQSIVAETLRTADGIRRISITDNDSCTQWVVYEKSGISIASMIENGVAISLPSDDAVVHAFLPTHERSGLGAKVNGDFSTDPSRTRVVFDERSSKCIKQFVDFLLDLIAGCIDRDDVDVIAPLVPQEDIRMAEFERPSFKRLFFTELLCRGKQRFSNYSLRPAWFKSFRDFQSVATVSGLTVLSSKAEKVDGLVNFLRALGAKEALIGDLDAGLKSVQLSANAAAEVTARIADLDSTKQLSIDFSDWKIWAKEGKVVSTKEFRHNPGPIENATLLAEKLGGEKVLGFFWIERSAKAKAKLLFVRNPVVRPVRLPALEPRGVSLRIALLVMGLRTKSQVYKSVRLMRRTPLPSGAVPKFKSWSIYGRTDGW